MLTVKKFTFNPLAEHTYVVYNQEGQCAIIDPGCLEAHEQKILTDFIQIKHLQVTHLINTHCHIDHIVGNAYLKKTYAIPLAIHLQDLPILQLATKQGPRFGIFGYEATMADIFLAAGNTIYIGKNTLQVMHVPGHSPGHIALYSLEDKFCIGGDVLFKNSVGRTDLPGGDYAILIKSIQEQFFVLEDDVVLYPGHGPNTTIGVEKRNNPYCKVV